MSRAKTFSWLALLFACLAGPVLGELIHKWVDADGVTHYSDEPPARAVSPVTSIELPVAASRAQATQSDYYSIGRQWQRMRAERLERDKIALEKARIKAAQAAREVPVSRPEAGATRYRVGYPLFHHHRPHRLLKPRPRPLPPARSPPGLHPSRNQPIGGYRPLP